MLVVEVEGREAALEEGLQAEEGPFQEGKESMDLDSLVVLEVVLHLGDLVPVVLWVVLQVVLSQVVIHHQDC